MKRPTRNTEAGRRYLDLQREAKRTGRPTDELIQLYALECFLDRVAHSAYADRFVLKGGVLLAALEARRPTRDIDFAARALENSAPTHSICHQPRSRRPKAWSPRHELADVFDRKGLSIPDRPQVCQSRFQVLLQ